MSKIAIALGTFDGIHLGHTAVLNKTVGFKKIALTFNTPPKGGNTNLLMTPEEKNKSLEIMGIKPIVLDFKEVKNLSPLEFLNNVKEKYNPSVIASGFNFHFGKNAEGNTDILLDFCNKNGIEYRLSNAVMFENAPISSTRIRQAVAKGDVLSAFQMLGRYFSFETQVTHGEKRGRTIGFPTINQPYPKELVVPRFGVYASMVQIDGKVYPAVTDIGIRPTFETDYIISETNIMDYNGDAYEKSARISLVGFLRDETKFGSLNELKSAIAKDKEKASKILEKISI
ncbi:MAG: riboflavin biosynthesis protein RibF [Acutalibacteraceae bacterium]|nr:riboflavin biosynthesis protein RibF [Acutalibacteraceae bacterium]